MSFHCLKRALVLTIGIEFIHAIASARLFTPETSCTTMFATKSTACEMLPSSCRIAWPSRASVCWYVPASNWNMPRPPCCDEHGPSDAPAITGPPQNDDVGPLHAHVASDQQCDSPVSTCAMPASRTPFVSPRLAATSRIAAERGRRAAPLSPCTSVCSASSLPPPPTRRAGERTAELH